MELDSSPLLSPDFEDRRAYSGVPRIGVGALICRERQVLLVRRRNDPGRGLWTIPGGLLQWGETLTQAVQREVQEECNLACEPVRILAVLDLIEYDADERPKYHYVLIDYLATALSDAVHAGSDAAEARWCDFESLAKLPLAPRMRNFLQQHLPVDGFPPNRSDA